MTDGTRDHLLLDARTGWRAAVLASSLEVGEDGALRLRHRPDAGRPLAGAAGSFGGLALATGRAVDPLGRLYALDAESLRLERFDPCTGSFELVTCIGGEGEEPRRFRDPHGIAISACGDLFVADTGNRRVQVFSLKGLALRRVWRSPLADGTASWQPWDLAVWVPRRWVYVSDFEGGRVHRFNVAGHWHGSLGDGLLERPTHLALDLAGRLYVVQEGESRVAVFDQAGSFVEWVERTYEVEGRFGPVAEVAAVADAADAGDATDSGAAAEAVFESAGSYLSEALDGRAYRCPWHRVVLDGRVAAGTRVAVATFTSESEKSAAEVAGLPEERWSRDATWSRVGDGGWDCLVRSAPGRYLWLRLTLAGDGAATPELCRARVYAPRRSSLRFLPAVYREDAESRDFLDRFLSIFDTLRQEISDEIDDVPRLFDPLATPAAFLPWLASWLGLVLDRSWPEDRRRRLLAAAPRLFRLRGTAEGLRLYLRLYAGLEPAVLEHFRLRRWLYLGSGRLGDRVAWGRAIVRRLELDEHSEIGTFQLLDQGDPTRDPFHHLAHRFTVYVPVCGGLGEAGREELRRQLRRIVELAKPAHTEGEVELVEPRFRIGSQSLVGVNTMIAAYPAGVVTGVSELGRGTLLGPSAEGPAPPTFQVGVRSRIGSSTLLD